MKTPTIVLICEFHDLGNKTDCAFFNSLCQFKTLPLVIIPDFVNVSPKSNIPSRKDCENRIFERILVGEYSILF